jgi:hypothetical protein
MYAERRDASLCVSSTRMDISYPSWAIDLAVSDGDLPDSSDALARTLSGLVPYHASQVMTNMVTSSVGSAA